MKILKLNTRSLLPVLVFSLAVPFAACDRDKGASAASTTTAEQTTSADLALPKLSLPADSGSPPAIHAARAMQYVREIVAFGPRPIGSTNHKKVEDYIVAHLKGDA